MKLYEITEEMKAVQALVDSGDMTDEMVADTLEALSGEFEDKARAVLMVRQGILADVAGVDKELERLNKLKTAYNNDAERLVDYLKTNMLRLEKDKVDLGIFKLTLRKPIKKLAEVDESKVPDQFFQIIPEQKKLDKRALLAAVKAVETDCAELTDSERSLQVR